MKYVPLSQGLFAAVDDEDYERVNAFNWSAQRAERTHYAVRKIRIDGKPYMQKMHRFILNLPAWRPFVDHIDHNGLNNQKANLRQLTTSQNAQNKRKPRTGKTSPYKGVRAHTGKFQAQIKHNGKWMYIGRYTDDADAARAYNKRALELFGEYACLNEVEGK
jgi:hypothetical protein